MEICAITDRNIVFRFKYPDWHLNLHLILGEKRDFLIDTGMGRENVEAVLKYRQERNRKQELIVVNTHYHFDHIWGNNLFRGHLIISHRRCPRMIEENWEPSRERYSEFWTEEIQKHLPNLLVSDEIYFPSERIRIFATPGHSIDGISVLDEIDGVLNVGDNIGDDMEKIVPELECEAEEYKKTIEKYRSLPFRYLVGGHNQICGKDMLDQILSSLQRKEHQKENSPICYDIDRSQGGVMLLLCHPKCTTCLKARAWLDTRRIAYELRDIRDPRPTEDELRLWHRRSGLPLRRFFNTSGQLYRSLDLAHKLSNMTEDEQYRLLASDGMLIKRPILITDHAVRVGFKEKEWEVL